MGSRRGRTKRNPVPSRTQNLLRQRSPGSNSGRDDATMRRRTQGNLASPESLAITGVASSYDCLPAILIDSVATSREAFLNLVSWVCDMFLPGAFTSRRLHVSLKSSQLAEVVWTPMSALWLISLFPSEIKDLLLIEASADTPMGRDEGNSATSLLTMRALQ